MFLGGPKAQPVYCVFSVLCYVERLGPYVQVQCVGNGESESSRLYPLVSLFFSFFCEAPARYLACMGIGLSFLLAFLHVRTPSVGQRHAHFWPAFYEL